MATYLIYGGAGRSHKTLGGYFAAIISDDTSSTHAIATLQTTAPADLGNPAPIATWTNAVVISNLPATDLSSTIWLQGDQVAQPYLKDRGQ